jgi:hypothetical protein
MEDTVTFRADRRRVPLNADIEDDTDREVLRLTVAEKDITASNTFS